MCDTEVKCVTQRIQTLYREMVQRYTVTQERNMKGTDVTQRGPV